MVSPKAQKVAHGSYARQRAYWPTLYRLGDQLVLARPRKVRVLADSRDEFFEELAKARTYFADLVAQELPAFEFDPHQRVRGQRRPGAWKAPLSIENLRAVERMCDHYGEVLLNLSDGVRQWLEGNNV